MPNGRVPRPPACRLIDVPQVIQVFRVCDRIPLSCFAFPNSTVTRSKQARSRLARETPPRLGKHWHSKWYTGLAKEARRTNRL